MSRNRIMTLTKRAEWLKTRIEEGKGKGLDLGYDKEELAALRYAISELTHKPTKRELIAAMMLQGYLSRPTPPVGYDLTELAIKWTDALLTLLEETKKEDSCPPGTTGISPE